MFYLSNFKTFVLVVRKLPVLLILCFLSFLFDLSLFLTFQEIQHMVLLCLIFFFMFLFICLFYFNSFFLFFCGFLLFIYSCPHFSLITLPCPTHPPTSSPVIFVHRSLYMFLELTLLLLSLVMSLPPPLWSLSICSSFPCLWFYFARLFVLLIRFHL